MRPRYKCCVLVSTGSHLLFRKLTRVILSAVYQLCYSMLLVSPSYCNSRCCMLKYRPTWAALFSIGKLVSGFCYTTAKDYRTDLSLTVQNPKDYLILGERIGEEVLPKQLRHATSVMCWKFMLRSN